MTDYMDKETATAALLVSKRARRFELRKWENENNEWVRLMHCRKDLKNKTMYPKIHWFKPPYRRETAKLYSEQ